MRDACNEARAYFLAVVWPQDFPFRTPLFRRSGPAFCGKLGALSSSPSPSTPGSLRGSRQTVYPGSPGGRSSGSSSRVSSDGAPPGCPRRALLRDVLGRHSFGASSEAAPPGCPRQRSPGEASEAAPRDGLGRHPSGMVRRLLPGMASAGAPPGWLGQGPPAIAAGSPPAHLRQAAPSSVLGGSSFDGPRQAVLRGSWAGSPSGGPGAGSPSGVPRQAAPPGVPLGGSSSGASRRQSPGPFSAGSSPAHLRQSALRRIFGRQLLRAFSVGSSPTWRRVRSIRRSKTAMANSQLNLGAAGEWGEDRSENGQLPPSDGSPLCKSTGAM
ncbi:translation initiation factor IF-2-like [Penaeus monodon]|uniref:translation initiation factor IF-2-like n=1 Tax=Penaeus monodon TaxID=6687 RepID=UPI0018A6FBAF|nr:translation initiation factor IF-2-like [Penaeus monodon]